MREKLRRMDNEWKIVEETHVGDIGDDDYDYDPVVIMRAVHDKYPDKSFHILVTQLPLEALDDDQVELVTKQLFGNE
tara:strand:+ start:55 stop:285 length:231 start_codon:yes stop_codon:yes gene_type:complete